MNEFSLTSSSSASNTLETNLIIIVATFSLSVYMNKFHPWSLSSFTPFTREIFESFIVKGSLLVYKELYKKKRVFHCYNETGGY